ncbi:hypothetical protein BDR07DRAFT_1487592 [Suillus spraguei]|nr:hypothetical protein BDR07DRAFT_1487592 [Suillus spraguei]
MQEALLHKTQPQNYDSSRAHFERELEFLEDKRDRAQLELSPYSQAMYVFQPQLGSHFGSPVIQLSVGARCLPGTCSRVGSGGLHRIDPVDMKCREWLSGISTGKSNSTAEGTSKSAKDTMPTIGKEPTSIASKLMTIYTMLVLPEVSTVTITSFTWVEECLEEYYMDDRAMEQASLQMLISQAGDLSDIQAEQHFLEAQLSLMQSRLRHAQTEVELLSDAIQHLIESNTNSPSPSLTPPSEIQPHFCTPQNIFGLVCQFFSSTPPSHDPEEAVTLWDISDIPSSRQEQPLSNMETTMHKTSPYYPYPNRSSLELGHWYWNGGVQKSQQSFNDLLTIITDPDFDSASVCSTPWEKINSTLGENGHEDGSEEWEDEDAGWHKMEVSIQVPFSRTSNHPGVVSYLGVELYHHSLIQEKLANAGDDK